MERVALTDTDHRTQQALSGLTLYRRSGAAVTGAGAASGQVDELRVRAAGCRSLTLTWREGSLPKLSCSAPGFRPAWPGAAAHSRAGHAQGTPGDQAGRDAGSARRQRQQNIPPPGVRDTGLVGIIWSGLPSRAGARLAVVTAGQLAGVAVLRTRPGQGRLRR